MFNQLLAILATIVMFSAKTGTAPKVLSSVHYSLADRYSNSFVNDVFSDNILLTLAYMEGKVKEGQAVAWNKVKAPGIYKLVLKPGQTFAFHNEVFDKYKGKVAATTNAHFSSREGFKSDGYLIGDGVCHLASFMNVVAKEAGLNVEAPMPHDFATIADVARKDGVAIFYRPDDAATSQLQNLYITNNKPKTIAFVFNHKLNSLQIHVEELN